MKPFTKLLGFDTKNMKMKTESIAGTTTFLTVSYILAVNPTILSNTGVGEDALPTAAALSAAITTLLLAFMAKLSFAQAPSMGLNAFFVYTFCQAMGHSWEQALAIALTEGLVFLLITFFNVRELVLDSIPKNLRYVISTGIDMFITFISLRSTGIIVAKEGTSVGLDAFTPESTSGAIVILLSGIPMARNAKGSLFYGIVVTTLVDTPMDVIMIPDGWLPIPAPQDISPIFCHFGFSRFFNIRTLLVFFSLLIVNILDIIGTLIGLVEKTDTVQPDDSTLRAKEATVDDAVGTACGAILRSFIITTYTESASGIVEGGRSGVTSAFAGIPFLLSLLVSLVFLLVPGVVTSGVLVLVGALMLDSMERLDLGDASESFPAFITTITTVLYYSIADGICLGILSYMILKLCVGRWKRLNITLVTLTILFVINFVFN